ncbi:MAG: hypothetical protein ACFCAD_03490 [Pleurocapsa sp.]
MKLQFKALSVTLGLVALLGVSTSVKSSTTKVSQAENSVEISPDEIELQDAEESDYNTGLEASEEIEDAELEASEEIEDAELEASEEIEDGETAEIETPELEASDDVEADNQSSIGGTIDDAVESAEDAVNDVESQF